MKLLVDTHILVWLAGSPSLLKPKERAAIAEAEIVAASVVSLWELRLKWDRRYASGERKGPIDPRELNGWAGRNAVPMLDLSAAVAIAQLDPPLVHTDPFDELLLIQAQEGGYRLLTRDKKLADHPLALVPA